MKSMFLAMVLAIGTASVVSACDPVYKKVVCYETVYVKVTKTVPYTKSMTRYDHCGKPYCVDVTCYKDVCVKVPKTVAVVKYVKVCE